MICAHCQKKFQLKLINGVRERIRKYCTVKCRTLRQNKLHKQRIKVKKKYPNSQEVNRIINNYSTDIVNVNYDWVFSTNYKDWCTSRDSRFRENYKKKQNEKKQKTYKQHV